MFIVLRIARRRVVDAIKAAALAEKKISLYSSRFELLL